MTMPTGSRAIHRELHSHLPPEPALRVKALESLLVEKGMLDPATVDAWIEVFTEEIGPKRGAAVVAKAWTDPAFKARLLADGTAAITELGFEGWAGGHLKVVENTPAVHNLVVCTLCSCYPHSRPRHSAQLVQDRRLPGPRRPRSARRAGRVRRDGPRRRRDPGLGFDRRASLHGAAGAAGRHRRLGRGGARRAGDAATR